MRTFHRSLSRAYDNTDGMLFVPDFAHAVSVNEKKLLIEVMKSDSTFRIRSYPGENEFTVYASGIASFEAAKVALELLS